MGPPPWQQACFQTVDTRLPPSPCNLCLGVFRKTPFLTFVPDSALSHSHPLPIHSPPVLEAKKFHFGVSLQGSSASLRTERTLALAAGSAEGQGDASCWWERAAECSGNIGHELTPLDMALGLASSSIVKAVAASGGRLCLQGCELLGQAGPPTVVTCLSIGQGLEPGQPEPHGEEQTEESTLLSVCTLALNKCLWRRNGILCHMYYSGYLWV